MTAPARGHRLVIPLDLSISAGLVDLLTYGDTNSGRARVTLREFYHSAWAIPASLTTSNGTLNSEAT